VIPAGFPGDIAMASYELRVRAEFSASHQIRLPSGEMEPLHDHNWRVDVFVEGEDLGEHGLLMDFGDLKRQLTDLTGGLDRSCLNDHAAFAADDPSTERLARFVHDALAPGLPSEIRISKVRIYETPDCAAAYLPDRRE
jgi:6-pyruvoyltetrahydropterin/6-carboxytetrahydropterin synthase